MIRTAICEDCAAQTEIILALLNKYKIEHPGIEMRIYCFDSANKLLNSFASGNVFDLMLLDIIMPGLNGIELAKEIRKLNKDVMMVFLTRYKDYALEAFDVSATQYILKPIKERLLFPVLDKAILSIHQEKERFFTLSILDRVVKISFSSIVCVELVSRKMKIYLENGTALTSKYIREPFSVKIAPLLEDSRFIYAHKSFAINFVHTQELTGDSFLMKNNIRVPIPRCKYTKVKEKYLSFLSVNKSY